MNDVFDRLMSQLADRVANRPAGSYTTQLVDGGVERMGAKILEEAAEVIEAAADGERDATIYEACDVLYHLWVLLASAGIGVDDLRRELARREGVSGLEEKARRTQS